MAEVLLFSNRSAASSKYLRTFSNVQMPLVEAKTTDTKMCLSVAKTRNYILIYMKLFKRAFSSIINIFNIKVVKNFYSPFLTHNHLMRLDFIFGHFSGLKFIHDHERKTIFMKGWDDKCCANFPISFKWL